MAKEGNHAESLKETAANSVQRAHHAATSGAAQLRNYNARLFEIGSDLKALQPHFTGAILLEFYACGKSCLGCPHHRWVKYLWRHGKMLGVNLRQENPSLKLRKTEENRSQILALMCEAKSLIERRGKLISIFQQMSKQTTWAKKAASQPQPPKKLVHPDDSQDN